MTIPAFYCHQRRFSHLGALPRLTQDVCGKALLQALGVHVPLTHYGAGVIDLHALQLKIYSSTGVAIKNKTTPQSSRTAVKCKHCQFHETAHQHIEGLELFLEALGKLPDLLGLRQVQDVDINLLQ